MKGLTHIIFGMGFVSFVLSFFQVPLIMWGIGTFFLSPIFSRLPDRDQTIARITFDLIVPHRGKGTHNLLYGLPLLVLFFIPDWSIFGSIFTLIIGTAFGALFAHAFVDAFNYGGIWVGIFKVKGFLTWESFWGNLIFKIIGIGLTFLSLINYL